jgi:hypothetical protein
MFGGYEVHRSGHFAHGAVKGDVHGVNLLVLVWGAYHRRW